MLESDQSLLRRVASRLAGVRTGIGASDVGDHLKTIHDRTIRLFLRTTSVGDAAGKLIDILNFVHEESTARLHPLFRPFVVAALEQLEALRRSRLGARGLEGATAYAAMIRAALAGTSVPFPGTPLRGVQVLGFLETRNLTFERVFVLDANEGVLPPRTDIDVFLPPETRAHLGLPDLREREDAGVYYFHQLAAGARELHVYYREGGKSERSRIVEKMVWDRQQRAGTLEERPFIGTVVRQANLVQSLPGALPKPPEVLPRLRGLTFSATMLDTYLSCPVRFAYRYLYGLEEREVVEEEVGRDDIGRLVHAILADFWRPAVGRTLVRSDADPSRLEAILDAKFTEQFGPEVGGARHLIRRQMERQLRAAVERYHGEVCAEGGVTLLGVEVRMEAEAGGHRFRGVADRIERRGETVHILDYKTGGNAGSRLIDFTSLNPSNASTWAGSIGSLQLPLYTLLYARTEGVAAERIVPAYVLLGRKTVGRKSEVRLYAEGDPVGAYHAMAEAAILAIVDQIVDPARPFEPTARPEKECAGCAFATICGTTWADR
jgi:RecB family exonuclease